MAVKTKANQLDGIDDMTSVSGHQMSLMGEEVLYKKGKNFSLL